MRSQPITKGWVHFITLAQFGSHLPQPHSHIIVPVNILQPFEQISIRVLSTFNSIQIFVQQLEISPKVHFGVPQAVSSGDKGW